MKSTSKQIHKNKFQILTLTNYCSLALANLMRTGESSLSSVQPVLFNLRRLAESCQAAVLVIHNTNRHGVFRGSSSISAAVDLMLSIRSAPTDSLIELHSLKARFSAPQPFCARAAFETTLDGQERFHLEPTDEKPEPTAPKLINGPPGTATAILEFIGRHQGSTREEITSSLPVYSEGTIRNVLHQLMNSGLIRRNDGGNQGKRAVYELSR